MKDSTITSVILLATLVTTGSFTELPVPRGNINYIRFAGKDDLNYFPEEYFSNTDFKIDTYGTASISNKEFDFSAKPQDIREIYVDEISEINASWELKLDSDNM